MEPPLGLLTVAAMIPDSYNLKLVDLNVTELNVNDIKSADLVFISAMIVQRDSFNEIVALCKQYNKTVVAGGPYASTSYHNIKNVDHFVVNEAETLLPGFFKDYENGVLKKVYINDGKPDLATTPPPRFNLINYKDYLRLSLQYSRGCPFNCEFCDIVEMYGRKPRTKNPEQFINELEVVYNSGYKGSIFVVDDNFIGSIKNTKKLLKKIILWQKKYNYPFALDTEASLNLANDEELLDLMLEAGFYTVFIGIESPDSEALKRMNKQQNLSLDMKKSVNKIQSKGFEITAGFIIGADGEPENIFDLQIEFIQQNAIPIAMVGILLVLPKTQLYRRLKKENRLLGESMGNNTHELELNFIPQMDEKKIKNGYLKILFEIYDPKNYFDRCIDLLKILPKKRVIKTPINILELLALIFLSLSQQAVSYYRLQYFKFLFKAIRCNPKNIETIFSYAIAGDHFLRITRDLFNKENNN